MFLRLAWAVNFTIFWRSLFINLKLCVGRGCCLSSCALVDLLGIWVPKAAELEIDMAFRKSKVFLYHNLVHWLMKFDLH